MQQEEYLFRKCRLCGEKHWETEPCAKEYEVYEKGDRAFSQTIREWTFHGAAYKFAEQFIGNANGRTSIEIIVEREDEKIPYTVRIEVQIEYIIEKNNEA